MKIIKSGEAAPFAQSELDKVNAFAKAELTEEHVYTFSVLLCDNEVDRDFERFTEETLLELSELFVGKTGISDHEWSAGRQKARIYRTELVTDETRRNSLGMPYMYLKGFAYMLRTESNAELIAEIEAGIRRETSVGCSVERSLCSICGNEIGSCDCGHCKGQDYSGTLCHAELVGAVDAYEWSFVAVPAQKNAGVLKKFSGSGSFGEKALEKQAALGRKYLGGLKKEVLRLALLCDRELHAGLEKQVGGMEEDGLLALKAMLERQLEGRFPPVTQLPGKNETTAFDEGEYII